MAKYGTFVPRAHSGDSMPGAATGTTGRLGCLQGTNSRPMPQRASPLATEPTGLEKQRRIRVLSLSCRQQGRLHWQWAASVWTVDVQALARAIATIAKKVRARHHREDRASGANLNQRATSLTITGLWSIPNRDLPAGHFGHHVHQHLQRWPAAAHRTAVPAPTGHHGLLQVRLAQLRPHGELTRRSQD